MQVYPSSRDDDQALFKLLTTKCPIAYIDDVVDRLDGPGLKHKHARKCFVLQQIVRNVDRATGHLTPTAAAGDPFTTKMRRPFLGFRVDGVYVGPDPPRPVGGDPFLGIGEDPLKRALDFAVSSDVAMISVVRRVCRDWNKLGKFKLVGTQNLAVFAKRIGRTASVKQQLAGASKLLTFCDLDVSGLVVPWMLGNDDTIAAYASLALLFMAKPVKVNGQRVPLARDPTSGKALRADGPDSLSPIKASLKAGLVSVSTENDHATQAILMAIAAIKESSGEPTLTLESYTCNGGNAILPIAPGLRKGLFGPYTRFKHNFMAAHQSTLVELRIPVKDTPLGGVWPSLRTLCVVVNNSAHNDMAQAIAESAVMSKLEHVDLRAYNQAPSLVGVPVGIKTLRLTGPEACSQGKRRYLRTCGLARFGQLVDLRMRGVCLNHNTDLTKALSRLANLRVYQNVLAYRGRGKCDHPEAWGIEPIHKLLNGRVTDAVEVRPANGKWTHTTHPVHTAMLKKGLELPNDWGMYQRGYTLPGNIKATVMRHPGGLVSYRTDNAEYELRNAPTLTLCVTPACIGGIELEVARYRHLMKALVIITDSDAYRHNFATGGPFSLLESVVKFVAM
jgi:hypothetical protein